MNFFQEKTLDQRLKERIEENKQMDKTILNNNELNNKNEILDKIKNSEINFNHDFNSDIIKNTNCKINDNETEECCICYNNSFLMKTKCKHNICLECIFNLKSTNCPMCRQEFPIEIKNILKKKLPNFHNSIMVDSFFSWEGTPSGVDF